MDRRGHRYKVLSEHHLVQCTVKMEELTSLSSPEGLVPFTGVGRFLYNER